jgi:putative glycosyltransferase (TIGR04348 family)
LVIVTPARAESLNGNWQTAARWARLLSPAYRVDVMQAWTADSGTDAALLIALHARRSAESIAAWRAAHPERPLLLVLTGTDLYRDIDSDTRAMQSLASAHALVVLNEQGPQRLPATLQARCHVVLQSCPARRPLPKPMRHLRALMVGHLRAEKDPATYQRAARLLADRDDIRLDHIGAALEPALARAARDTERLQPRYRWLGVLPHAGVRRRIQAAHVLVHASRMEGGANVIVEAMRSGTPVIASAIEGNLGLLGADYPGVFPPGDAAALATLLGQARDDADMLADLARRCAERAPLFSPERERATLLRILADLLAPADETRP